MKFILLLLLIIVIIVLVSSFNSNLYSVNKGIRKYRPISTNNAYDNNNRYNNDRKLYMSSKNGDNPYYKGMDAYQILEVSFI